MPRANRHYIPGYVWHITHRCHKQEFLLRFARDKRRWIAWLFEARKRYGLSILSYIVTSNHIHLLVSDNGDNESIPKSMQLLAGRTGQQYNQRKGRTGAFWEDRYHATAVERDEHLMQCMVYIALNMVRAGVVRHPDQWPYSSYHEIQTPRNRYRLIDYEHLMALFGIRDLKELQEAYSERIQEACRQQSNGRENKWTESIAVGSKVFVEDTKEKLGMKAHGREIIGRDGTYQLREASKPYGYHFDHKNDDLRLENGYFWDDIS
jgi:putative transposase